MTAIRRLTVDAVLKMASTAAHRHMEKPVGKTEPSTDLINALAATWELVKGRLGQTESAVLDALITQIIGKSFAAKHENAEE